MDMNQTDLWELLGVTQPAAGKRLSGLKQGKDKLKYSELLLIFQKFEATDAEILKFMKL